MPPADLVSAVVIRVGLPAALERLRRLHDPAAAAAVPAHITLIYPFFAATRLTPAVRADLAALVRGIAPFEVWFTSIGRFPGVLYLVPEPTEPFADLVVTIWSKFPEHPPYGGVHDDVRPHLTIAASSPSSLDAIANDVACLLPFGRQVAAIHVLAQDPGPRWRTRWRIALGDKP